MGVCQKGALCTQPLLTASHLDPNMVCPLVITNDSVLLHSDSSTQQKPSSMLVQTYSSNGSTQPTRASKPGQSYVQAARQGLSKKGKEHHSVTPLSKHASEVVRAQLLSVSREGEISTPYLLDRGSEYFSVFFDATTACVTEAEFFNAARVLLTDWDVGIGMLHHREKGRLLYEVTLPDEDICNKVIQNGVSLEVIILLQ